MREASRYMGQRLPGARVVSLPGADHLPWEGAQADVPGIVFEERGAVALPGASREWRVFAVTR